MINAKMIWLGIYKCSLDHLVLFWAEEQKFVTSSTPGRLHMQRLFLRIHITKCFTWLFWWKWKSQLFNKRTRILWLAEWVMIQQSTLTLLVGSSFFLSWLDILDVSQSMWLNILMIFPQSMKNVKAKTEIKTTAKFSFMLLLWIIFSFPLIHLLFLFFCFVLVSLLNCDIFNQQIVPLSMMWSSAMSRAAPVQFFSS